MADEEKTPAAPVEKKEMMEHVGRTLNERRKLRKLSISDISQSLKIRGFYIEAMESGRWSDLPGEVYVRGFIIRYAQYLGLNGRELMAPYIEKVSNEVRPGGELSPQFKKGEVVRSAWVWAGFAILFFAGLIKFLKPAPPRAVIPATKPVPVAPLEKAPADDVKPVVAKHKLDVYAPEQLWLRVKSSDRMFEGFIPEGATWSFTGQGQFDIRMGHSRNVTLQFDGQTVKLGDEQRKILLPNEN